MDSKKIKTDTGARYNEIMALESMFADSIKYTVYKGSYFGTMNVDVDIPNNLCLKFPPKDSAPVPIKYLPPIQLCFQLKDNYPHWGPPGFSLICSWLTPYQISELCTILDKIWKDTKPNVVIFDWVTALKQNTFLLLNLSSTIDLTELVEMSKDLKSEVDKYKYKCSKKLLPYDYIPDKKRKYFFDERAITSWEIAFSLKNYLITHNASQEMEEFNKGWYSCNVCYENLPGHKCTKFKKCGHIFCRSCCKNYFEIQIKDGNVNLLSCLEENCTSQAHPSQVGELVSPELYDRYDYLLLTSALDTMTDIIFCPMWRCGQPIVIENQEEKMATCPSCDHAFCMFCRKTYHGIEPCRINKQEKQKIIKLYQNGDIKERNRLESRYGRKELKKLVEESLSEEWVNSHTKQCPKCGASIEKIEGCHKMTCRKCQTFFCWLCLEVLDSANPYRHFNDETSPCFNLLFHGITLEDEEGEDDDWQFGMFL